MRRNELVGRQKSHQEKKKAISPELEERQKQASAHMHELGVPPLQIRIYYLLFKPVIYLCMYCLIFF